MLVSSLQKIYLQRTDQQPDQDWWDAQIATKERESEQEGTPSIAAAAYVVSITHTPNITEYSRVAPIFSVRKVTDPIYRNGWGDQSTYRTTTVLLEVSNQAHTTYYQYGRAQGSRRWILSGEIFDPFDLVQEV